jgi:2-oxoglutarate ferredoxin oxidoreductase subunit alpha
MMEKRLSKMKLLEQEVEEPELLGVPGQVIMVAWGSLYGPVKEAVEQLNSAGYQVGALVFGDLWPFPRQKLESLATENRVFINVEQNYTGQLARLIRQETSIVCTKSLLKYDGRPFGPEEICRRLKEEVL